MQRLVNAIAMLAAAVLLSGCYIYALAPPASEDAAVDHRLSGAWYVLDKQGEPNGVLLHFVLSRVGGPMRMVSTDDGEYGVFELYSVPVGDKQVFAMRKLSGAAAGSAIIAGADNTKFLLGTYRIKNDDTLFVHLYDSKKVGAAIAAGTIRGKVAAGAAPPVTLTGTPQDLLRTLATTEMQAAINSEAFPIARRAGPPR
jgi:hypothetical protein